MQYLSKVKTDLAVFFYILEGRPEITVNDETEIFCKDFFIHCPAECFHCINNPATEKVRILILKSKF